MKSTLWVFLLMAFTISLVSRSSAQVQSNSVDKQISTMLKEFYTSYITEVAGISNEKKVTSIQLKYCTMELVNKIDKQFKTQKIDYDPFIKAQDADTQDLKTLSVAKDLKKPNGYTVSYVDTYSKKKITINLTVIKQGDSFKINSVL